MKQYVATFPTFNMVFENFMNSADPEYWSDERNLPADLKDRLSVGKKPKPEEAAEIQASKKFLGNNEHGTPVYTVDGELVRQWCYPDFSLGGNDMAYPNFIPKDEIWIDQDIEGGNRETTIAHESTERYEMFKQHKFYDVGSGKGEHGAHVDALGTEHEIRLGERPPEKLTK